MKKIIVLIIMLIALHWTLFCQFNSDFLYKHKYGWDSIEKYSKARKDKLARQKLLQIYDLQKQNILDNVLKSAVVPGWGQLSTKHYTKGQIIMGTEIFLLGSFIYYNDKYRSEYKNYKKATYIVDIEDYYDKANEYYTTSRAIIGLGIAVWVYNIYDSVINTSHYNQDIWNSLYNDYKRKKITFSPLGFSVRF